CFGVPVEPEVRTTAAAPVSAASSRSAHCGRSSCSAGRNSTGGPSPRRAASKALSACVSQLLMGISAPMLRGRRVQWGSSVVVGVVGPVGGPLRQERVATLDRLIGHVAHAGGLAGEDLLAGQAVVDGVEGELQ